MTNNRLIIKISAAVMGLSGIAILVSVLYPIFSYEWEAGMKYPNIISPPVNEETATFRFENKDYTRLGQWFDDRVKEEDLKKTTDNFYTLSVPKLEIDSAVVKIGGEELSGSLIQYPGTALPGEIGNSVIFGHSILPQFYDPKNYLAVFSILNKLENNDDIFVSYSDKLFRYQVDAMFEVSPKDIQILQQSSNGSYLTLVTCTPPGHPLKPRRLIVRAKLVDIN